MLHVLSFALFSTVLIVSIGAIVATIRAELPLIMKVLGVDPQIAPPVKAEGGRRPVRVVRVVRQARLTPMALPRHAAA